MIRTIPHSKYCIVTNCTLELTEIKIRKSETLY